MRLTRLNWLNLCNDSDYKEKIINFVDSLDPDQYCTEYINIIRN